jgi:hypothetical protein
MRLPFVSRARYELAQHNLEEMRKLAHAAEERAKSYEALFSAEVMKRDALIEKLLTLKQQGYTTATERQTLPAPPPSRIEEVIIEKAGSNGALRRHLSRWAAQRQAMKVPDDEIVDALVNWKDPDADEASQ